MNPVLLSAFLPEDRRDAGPDEAQWQEHFQCSLRLWLWAEDQHGQLLRLDPVRRKGQIRRLAASRASVDFAPVCRI